MVYEYVKREKAGGNTRAEAEQVKKIEHMLAQHATRLRVCLQDASGDSSGPEEGSDAWLLLSALTREAALPSLVARFEQSGHASRNRVES